MLSLPNYKTGCMLLGNCWYTQSGIHDPVRISPGLPFFLVLERITLGFLKIFWSLFEAVVDFSILVGPRPIGVGPWIQWKFRFLGHCFSTIKRRSFLLRCLLGLWYRCHGHRCKGIFSIFKRFSYRNRLLITELGSWRAGSFFSKR